MSETTGKKKKIGVLQIIIIVLLIIIIVGGGTFTGFYFANRGKTGETVEEKINEITFSMDEFTVNLADESGRRYVKAKIYIGFEENKKIAEEVEEKKPMLRDAINSVLRSKKAEDYSAKGVEDIKKEIMTRVSPILENTKPVNVYFYDILVQ